MGLTIGLVGCGRWGAVHLRTLQNLKSTGHVRRVVVCDIDADKLAHIQADATYASSAKCWNTNIWTVWPLSRRQTRTLTWLGKPSCILSLFWWKNRWRWTTR